MGGSIDAFPLFYRWKCKFTISFFYDPTFLAVFPFLPWFPSPFFETLAPPLPNVTFVMLCSLDNDLLWNSTANKTYSSVAMATGSHPLLPGMMTMKVNGDWPSHRWVCRSFSHIAYVMSCILERDVDSLHAVHDCTFTFLFTYYSVY